MEKWIDFEFMGSTGKTKCWQVVTKDRTHSLGSVHWFGRWMQYAFFPIADTVYERQCLRDIADFCERETKAHREANKEVPVGA